MDNLATQVVQAYLQEGKTIATAESCTGGLVGGALTAVSGSSSVYMGGIISYTNPIKHRLVGVKQELLDEFGAVSQPVAKAMAEGVRQVIDTTVGVSVTGVAGPNPDDWNNPVGLVYIAVSDGKTTHCQTCNFSGDRASVRNQAVEVALKMLKTI
ncbi:MAG: CinA family protein [Eubacteriales bacterium]